MKAASTEEEKTVADDDTIAVTVSANVEVSPEITEALIASAMHFATLSGNVLAESQWSSLMHYLLVWLPAMLLEIRATK